jgi:hydrogenase maturation protease
VADAAPAARKVLVAGIGNIFFSDDGFGVEVARHLTGASLPDGVIAADFGIRGLHLACEMLDGYDEVIFIDALAHGGAPGDVVVIRPETSATGTQLADAHAMTPDAVLALLTSLGGRAPHVRIVGCEPATIEPGIGLSSEVAAAVDRAAQVVIDLVNLIMGRDSRVPRDTRTAGRAVR